MVYSDVIDQLSGRTGAGETLSRAHTPSSWHGGLWGCHGRGCGRGGRRVTLLAADGCSLEEEVTSAPFPRGFRAFGRPPRAWAAF